jgi:hypothetical protein
MIPAPNMPDTAGLRSALDALRVEIVSTTALCRKIIAGMDASRRHHEDTADAQ